jgi:hypothetical protein
MPTARALSPAEQANDTQTTHAPAKRTRVKASAVKREHARHHAVQRTPSDRAPTKLAVAQAKKHASPLLIGAGLGAAVALSIVALRSKERAPTLALFASPNSTFFSALVKTLAFAVGHAAPKDSLAGLVARAAGKAVA